MGRHRFASTCRRVGLDFFVGVPDSLLSPVVLQLQELYDSNEVVVAANEGAAVGLAIGHHLSGGGIPLVFLQNSGLGNAINPLIALADTSVYSIPMVLLVGWRGAMEAGGLQVHDEPQHLAQGRITPHQLDLLGIPYEVVDNEDDASLALHFSKDLAERRSGPVAILARKDTFENETTNPHAMQLDRTAREEYVNATSEITSLRGFEKVPVIATTGMASRELFEARARNNEENVGSRDFLTVGGMGHAISIASGIARNLHPQRTICLDGDGAVLMHTGALAYAGRQSNLVHVVLDNGVHDSVGGQETGFRFLDVAALADAFGYSGFVKVETQADYRIALAKALRAEGSYFIQAICKPGARGNLGRPVTIPAHAKLDFMNFLASSRPHE